MDDEPDGAPTELSAHMQRLSFVRTGAEADLEVGYGCRIAEPRAAVRLVLLGRLPEVVARRGVMATRRHPACAGADHAPLRATEHLAGSTLIPPVFRRLSSSAQACLVGAPRSAASWFGVPAGCLGATDGRATRRQPPQRKVGS
jgi:hypothetical protein